MKSLSIRFMIGLALGIVCSLVYGWLIRPVEYIDTDPSSLRADYRTDYVLMVAEAYSADRNMELALPRLAALGPQPPSQMVKEALDYAMQHRFSEGDIQRINRLGVDLEIYSKRPEIGSP